MPISSIVEAALVPLQLLGELFVEKGLITHEELEEALAEQKVSGKRLGEVLVKKGFVSGPALTTVLAEQLGVEMETQEGFGSGLWSEIKRRHLRGRLGEDDGSPLEVGEPEPTAEPRLAVIEGLFGDFDEREADEPVAGVSVVDGELQNLRQQLSFAAERLDEERAAHEGTQRLLGEARVEAEAYSREAEDWRQRAADAEGSGQETQAVRAELAELNAVATDLRAELAAREEALQRDTEAEAELKAELAQLQAELTDLREHGTTTEADLSKLTKQLEGERAANAETQELLDKARTEAVELASVVAELRAELAAREEALQRDTEAEAELEAELARLQVELTDLREHGTATETDLSALTKQLEDERAANEASQRLVDESRAEAIELDELVTRLRAELVRREVVVAEHAEQLDNLRDELAAGEAARDREADARVATETELAQLRADTVVLHQRLDDERAENVASRREVGRLESHLSELAPIGALLAEAECELAARTEELAELALELEHVRGLLPDRDAASPVEEIVAGHIVFRPGAGGYELAERPGPPPEVGTVEDVGGARFLVTRIGRSPLPADRRRCAYLEAA